MTVISITLMNIPMTSLRKGSSSSFDDKYGGVWLKESGLLFGGGCWRKFSCCWNCVVEELVVLYIGWTGEVGFASCLIGLKISLDLLKVKILFSFFFFQINF